MLYEESEVGGIVSQRRFEDVENLGAQDHDAVRTVGLCANAMQQVCESRVERQPSGSIIDTSKRRIRKENMIGKAREPVEGHPHP